MIGDDRRGDGLYVVDILRYSDLTLLLDRGWECMCGRVCV